MGQQTEGSTSASRNSSAACSRWPCGVPTQAARKRLIAVYDHSITEPEWALGYRWDIVVRGLDATPFESREGEQ